MRIESPRNISTYLIVLGLLVFLIGILMLFLSYWMIKNLEYDANIINQAGIVRGSIQRLTKLELSGCPGFSCDSLEQKIDALLYDLLRTGDKFQSRAKDQSFIDTLQKLNREWVRLKNLILEYQKSPVRHLQQQIILQSEQCWSIADTAVLAAQITTEGKIQNIRLLYYLVLASIINTLLIIWLIHQFVRKKLEYRAAYDGLTGLLNKASYQASMKRELTRSVRYHRHLALIVFDIDYFKKVNDTYGHRLGDKTLTQLAALVKSSVRQSDLVFRIGGEEFAVISPESDWEAARQIAEKIRWDVEQHLFHQVGNMTISLGIAEIIDKDTPTSLFQRADKALYLAKANGRNRVEPMTE